MALSITAVIIEGQYYNVYDFPFDEVEKHGPDALRKACAYRYQTDMTSGLFPYWGTISHKELKHWDRSKAKVGIYFIELSEGSYSLRIIRPKTPEQWKEYQLGNERDILAAVMGGSYAPDQFLDTLVKGASGDSFMPPLRSSDDFLNSIMKTAIRLKDAPFDQYKRRLEALAADKNKKSEGVNIANNSKRALINNDSLSASKFMTYADTWELEAAIVLKDLPDAANPMFQDGTMLVIYPSGVPFEIPNDKLMDISDYIAENLDESSAIKPSDKESEED